MEQFGYAVACLYKDEEGNVKTTGIPCDDRVREARFVYRFFSLLSEKVKGDHFHEQPWADLVLLFEMYESVVEDYAGSIESMSFTDIMDIAKTFHDSMLEETKMTFFLPISEVKIFHHTPQAGKIEINYEDIM